MFQNRGFSRDGHYYFQRFFRFVLFFNVYSTCQSLKSSVYTRAVPTLEAQSKQHCVKEKLMKGDFSETFCFFLFRRNSRNFGRAECPYVWLYGALCEVGARGRSSEGDFKGDKSIEARRRRQAPLKESPVERTRLVAALFALSDTILFFYHPSPAKGESNDSGRERNFVDKWFLNSTREYSAARYFARTVRYLIPLGVIRMLAGSVETEASQNLV